MDGFSSEEVTRLLWDLPAEYLSPESLRASLRTQQSPSRSVWLQIKLYLTDLTEQKASLDVPGGRICWKREKSLTPKCSSFFFFFSWFPQIWSPEVWQAVFLVNNSLINGMAAPGWQQEHAGLAGTAGFGHLALFYSLQAIRSQTLHCLAQSPRDYFSFMTLAWIYFLSRLCSVCVMILFCTALRLGAFIWATLIFGAVFMAAIGWDPFFLPLWFAFC